MMMMLPFGEQIERFASNNWLLELDVDDEEGARVYDLLSRVTDLLASVEQRRLFGLISN